MAWRLRFFPFLFFFTFILQFTSPAIGQSGTYTREDTLRGYLGKFRTVFDVKHYNLDVSVDVGSRFISGRNDILLQAVHPFSMIQLDLFRNMILDSIRYRNDRIPFSREGNAFFVDFRQTVDTNDTLTVSVYYHGSPIVSSNPPWDGGFVWAADSLGRSWVGVACEGTGASLWWPNKDHLSDEPDSMHITLRYPEKLNAVSNGSLVREKVLPGGMKASTWKVSYPINNYNVTLNLANYGYFSDVYRNKQGKLLQLNYHVLDYNMDVAPEHFEQVKGMLACYEHYLGEYPFWKDGYALVETPYWGMEHQSCVAYGNDFENNEYGFDYIIIHESAHEYWGNSVSTRDHGELWIHESFATYMEALYVEYFHGRDSAQLYLNLQRDLIMNVKPILGPLYVNYNGWTDADMYYKGSWMLHSLRNTVANDSLWFIMFRDLYQNFKYQTVSSTDIIDFLNGMTDIDLNPVFEQYLTTTDVPVLKVNLRERKNDVRITYKWKNVVKEFNMPVIVNTGEDQEMRLYPAKKKQKVIFSGKTADQVHFDNDRFYYQIDL